MSARFAPCPSCARHVKQSDSTCPFCGNEVAHVNAPARLALGRLSRSALFAAGAAGLALATMDCGSAQSSYGGPVVCTSADGSDTTCGAGVLPNPDAASEDASAASSSTPDASAEAGPTEGGSDAGVSPTDGGEAGH
jgi:hypothetical protein